MHYIIYRMLNKLLIKDDSKKTLNPGQASELQNLKLIIPTLGITEQLGNEDFGAVLHGLNAKGLIGYFQTGNHNLDNGAVLPHLSISPTSLGIQLYAIANNMFPEWRKYSTTDFGDFPDVKLPDYYSYTVEGVLEQAGLKKSDPDPLT